METGAGLCQRCARCLMIASPKGPVYYRCLHALEDSRFPQYPQLPVRRCLAFVAGLPQRAGMPQGE